MQKIILALVILMGISSFAKAEVIKETIPYPNVDMTMFLALTPYEQEAPPEQIAAKAYERAATVCKFLKKPNFNDRLPTADAYAENIELGYAQNRDSLLIVIDGNRTFADQYSASAKFFKSITCAVDVAN